MTALNAVILCLFSLSLFACEKKKIDDETPKPVEVFKGVQFDPFSLSLGKSDFEKYKNLLHNLTAKEGLIAVPFVKMQKGSGFSEVFIDANKVQSEIVIENRKYTLPSKHLPVSTVYLKDNSLVVFSRLFPSSDFHVLQWSAKATAGPIAEILQRSSDSYLFFRDVVVSDYGFDLVVYDNVTEKNYLWLMRKKKDKFDRIKEIELPSLNPPAGSHYEMEPKIFIHRLPDKSLSIVGGNLAVIYKDGQISETRLDGCLRVIEAFESSGNVYKVCESTHLKNKPEYLIFDGTHRPIRRMHISKGIPFNFFVGEKGEVEFFLANTPKKILELFIFDISRSFNSGMLDLGVNNSEGRIPWSQIYYLNGFLDVFALASRDERAWDIYGEILPQMYDRLYIETVLLTKQLMSSRGLKTKGFTVGRAEAVFAVQTSRILLYLNRAIDLFGWNQFKGQSDRLANQVTKLSGHIDVLAKGGEANNWIDNKTPYLKWPKGSAFYYDGAPVPYNHQNEWSYGVIDYQLKNLTKDKRKLSDHEAILKHFMRHVMVDGSQFPNPDGWHYWWGRGYDGWTENEGISTNKTSYSGDKYPAWISFRTIDLMSILEGLKAFDLGKKNMIIESAKMSVEQGTVYPFAARALLEHNQTVALQAGIAYSYARSIETWEMASSPWALVQISENSK